MPGARPPIDFGPTYTQVQSSALCPYLGEVLLLIEDPGALVGSWPEEAGSEAESAALRALKEAPSLLDPDQWSKLLRDAHRVSST